MNDSSMLKLFIVLLLVGFVAMATVVVMTATADEPQEEMTWQEIESELDRLLAEAFRCVVDNQNNSSNMQQCRIHYEYQVEKLAERVGVQLTDDWTG